MRSVIAGFTLNTACIDSPHNFALVQGGMGVGGMVGGGMVGGGMVGGGMVGGGMVGGGMVGGGMVGGGMVGGGITSTMVSGGIGGEDVAELMIPANKVGLIIGMPFYRMLL